MIIYTLPNLVRRSELSKIAPIAMESPQLSRG